MLKAATDWPTSKDDAPHSPAMDDPLSTPLAGPLPTLEAWTAHFQAAPIPVLASTAEALEALRAREDEVDANLIGETVAVDPLMLPTCEPVMPMPVGSISMGLGVVPSVILQPVTSPE